MAIGKEAVGWLGGTDSGWEACAHHSTQVELRGQLKELVPPCGLQ